MASKLKLTPGFVTDAFDTEAFSVRFNADDNFLAAAGSHGTVSIFNVATGQEAYRLKNGAGHTTKQVCWRPEKDSASVSTRGILVAASTDGRLRQWHVTS